MLVWSGAILFCAVFWVSVFKIGGYILSLL